LDALIERAPDWQPNGSAGQQLLPPISTEKLKTMTFDPIKYVVPSVIVEGLTLFAGKPKIGKSWLLLIHCMQGDVLYCALEDNLRRLQSRMTKLLGIAQDWPERLFVYCELPRLAEGGLGVLKSWIEKADHPRLIIIDTLAMVRAPVKRKDQTQYDADYAAVLELRALANNHNVAVVAVGHLRKAEADDPFDTISGTLGLTGAVDTILVLKREPTGIVLHGRGRDLVDVEKAMTFNSDSCTWTITGEAATVRRSAERQAILEALSETSEALGPRDIADTTGMRPANIRKLLAKLIKEGAVEKAGYGKYRPSMKLEL
jgi:RecA-family ATPase